MSIVYWNKTPTLATLYNVWFVTPFRCSPTPSRTTGMSMTIYIINEVLLQPQVMIVRPHQHDVFSGTRDLTLVKAQFKQKV